MEIKLTIIQDNQNITKEFTNVGDAMDYLGTLGYMTGKPVEEERDKFYNVEYKKDLSREPDLKVNVAAEEIGDNGLGGIIEE